MPNQNILIIILIIMLVIIHILWPKNEGFGCSVETQLSCDMIPNCIWSEGSCPNNNCNTICNKYVIIKEENINQPFIESPI